MTEPGTPASAEQAAPAGAFERVVLPHLDAAYSLARYLLRDAADAEDAVQESVLRALRYFHTLRDQGGARAWFLAIVRRECYVERGNRGGAFPHVPYEEAPPLQLVDSRRTPEDATQHALVVARLEMAIDELPDRLREPLVLREVQHCTYQEIAVITGAPLGTVMSRLSRARARLAASLGGVVDAGDAT